MIDKFRIYQQVKIILSPALNRVKLALACESLKIEKLCDQDYMFLSEYVSVIKPISNAITYLEGDVQTFGGYLPMLFSVRQTLKDLHLSDSLEFCKPLLTAVRDGFDKRFGHLMKLPSTYETGDPKAVPLFLAMITNPEYRLNYIPNDWFHSNPYGLSQIKSLLLNAMKAYLNDAKEVEDRSTNVNQNSFSEGNLLIYCRLHSIQHRSCKNHSIHPKFSSVILKITLIC